MWFLLLILRRVEFLHGKTDITFSFYTDPVIADEYSIEYIFMWEWDQSNEWIIFVSLTSQPGTFPRNPFFVKDMGSPKLWTPLAACNGDHTGRTNVPCIKCSTSRMRIVSIRNVSYPFEGCSVFGIALRPSKRGVTARNADDTPSKNNKNIIDTLLIAHIYVGSTPTHASPFFIITILFLSRVATLGNYFCFRGVMIVLMQA